MIIQSNDIQKNEIDAKLLASLITELNIARRNSLAYPKGHPLIAGSLGKILCIYEELLGMYGELILGVTHDALMVSGNILEKSNIVFKNFSKALFDHGIAGLFFQRGLTISELTNFISILGLKREQIQQQGGIEQLWSASDIVAISIRPIRYDLFQTSEEDSITSVSGSAPEESVWERFARELTLGELHDGNSEDPRLDPEVLAELLNQQFARGNISETDVRRVITDFIEPSDLNSTSETLYGKPYQKLAAFISNLTPDLRRQFLNSSFKGKGQDRQAAAERIVNNLSSSAILGTIDDINHNLLNVSPVVFNLLQRLGKNVNSSQADFHELSEDDDLSQKMKTIFREHASEEFIPDDYQQKLSMIISSDTIPRSNMEEVADLITSTESTSIEFSIGHILMNLIREGVETPEERELLLQNLSDMFGYFLQIGDYVQLHSMIDNVSDGTFPVEIQNSLREKYSQREYLEEILDGLTTWGKPRYDDIRSLINKIGGPFVEAILDRLSDEKKMSIRRFYMDCLIVMQSETLGPVLNRLSDNRWYFLRNLLIIITAINDPSVVPHVRTLLHHDDSRLHLEVVKTLLHFRDPHVENKILEDLDSQNPEQLMATIQLSERCAAPTVAIKLAGMLSQGGYSLIECERKTAIIHALGEIRRADALPELAKFLSLRSLIHSSQLSKLKMEVIHTLPKYPPKISHPVLECIASGSGAIARLASEILAAHSGNLR